MSICFPGLLDSAHRVVSPRLQPLMDDVSPEYIFQCGHEHEQVYRAKISALGPSNVQVCMFYPLSKARLLCHDSVVTEYALAQDELGGYYHRLGTDQCAKQRRGRAQIKLKGDNTIGNKLADSGGNSTNENGAGCGIATLQQRQQQQQQLQQQGNRR